MTSSLQVLFGDDDAVRPADPEFYDLLDTVEVEENAALPGAFELTLPVATSGEGAGEDLLVVGDTRFRPYARVAVVIGVEGQRNACIFDGYVLAHTVHLDRGTTASTARVWGQDVSCLMDMVEKTQERPGTDGQIAKTIFGDYRLRENHIDDGADDERNGHTLIQRGTDMQFLRERARRTGRLFRVCCEETPGQNSGYFVKPSLDGDAVATLTLNPVESANVEALEFSWDVIRPTEVTAETLVESKDAVKGGAQESGPAKPDRQSLGAFAGRSRTTRLTAAVNDAGELRSRSEALLREAGWFVRCEGEADLANVQRVLRVGTVVQIDGAGKLHSGKYLVWNVRHTISAESHRMGFVLVRNFVGAT